MASRKEDAFGPHELYLGIDVGKSFHWAVGVDGDGAVVIDRPLPNRQADVDSLLGEAGTGALVVVDQKNNIGALVVRRCRAAGVDVGYMPGRTMKQARDMFPGTAKTDRIDAEIIARTALGMRCVVLPIAENDDLGASVSLLSSQLAYATKRATMARNRLHAVLLESDPALEAGVDLSSAWQLSVMAELGGAAGISGAGRRRYRSLCGRLRAREAARDGLWDAAVASARDGWHPDAEDSLVRSLAGEILSADSERASLEADIASRLSGDETYRCLLTVPGIGPKTATALVTWWTSRSSTATTASPATAGWRRPTGGAGPRSTRPPRPGPARSSSRTCSSSAATPSSAPRAGSGGTTTGAGRPTCRTTRRSRPSRASASA